MRPSNLVRAGGVALAVAAAFGLATSITQADPPKRPKVPVFQVDTSFPKPLPVAGQFGTPLKVSSATGKPMPWVTGEVAGTCVDSHDHVFTVNRGNLVSPEGTTVAPVITPLTAVPSPIVIEFDSDGNVVNAWNSKGVQTQIHGCFVDYQDNIWIAGNGDGIVEKWTHDGKTMLLQIGTQGVCDNPPANTCGNSGTNPAANQSHTLLNEPANVWVDPGIDPQSGKRGAVYIADGYGNHRVVVFQDNHDGTATYLRQWGFVAGTVNDPLTDSPAASPRATADIRTCAVGGNDETSTSAIVLMTGSKSSPRWVIWCASLRSSPARARRWHGGAAGLGTAGSAWDLRFTNDAMQTYMFEVDGGNEISARWIASRARSSRIWPAGARARPVHLPAQQHGRPEGQYVHRRDDQRTAHPEVRPRRVQSRQRQGRRQG
jgi:hypothetical protein